MISSIRSLIGGVLLLCLSSLYPPQTDVLQQKVSADYQNVSIQEVLTDLREQYGLKFAYLNNELPAEQSVTLNLQNVPLREVLDAALSDTSLSYQLVNGQIVLKRNPAKASQPTAEPEIQKTSAPNKSTEEKEEAGSSVPGPVASTKNVLIEEESQAKQNEPSGDDSSESDLSDGASEVDDPVLESPEENNNEEADVQAQNPSSTETEAEDVPVEAPSRENETTQSDPESEQSELPKKNSISEKITQTIRRGMNSAIFDNLPDNSPYESSPFHVGIIYPISSNGTKADQYVNKLSLHLLVGYSAGLDGLEASAFGNVENDFVDGAQFAGFFNLVKNRVEGMQAAGFVNINGGTLTGAQFAGFLNTSLDSTQGVQGAGFLNLSTGYTRGGQFAGFTNISTQDAHAIQSSGFANVVIGELRGAQFSGFGNYAHQVDGAQFAGFVNVATGHVNGFQGSGFINIARTVKGVQLSVFNVADSVDGVPIGFLSIVRKNGYRTLEVWGGETMNANVAFKIGVRNFYNIFSFGTQLADTDFRYGLGYGIGHISAISPTIDLSVDVLGQQIYEDGNQIFDQNNQLNLLSTFRLGFAKQFSQHFGVFAAPTFNVLVSELTNDDGSIGSNLAPYTFFDETYNNRTNVQMWIGFNVGLRF